MSNYLIHIAFSLNFPDAAQCICLQLSRSKETVILNLELAWLSKDLSKAWFVSCDAKSKSIFIHQSFTLKADLPAAKSY